MRIVFNNLDIFYFRLASTIEKIKNSSLEEEDSFGSQMQSDIIALPFPIRNARLYFEINKKGYSATFYVTSNSQIIYNNSSDKIGREVRKNLEMGWTTLHHDAVGMVLDKEKFPYMVIADLGYKSSDRAIYLGTGGAPRILFKEYGDFNENLKHLEELVNISVKSWLEPLEKNKKINTIPNAYFFVNA